MGRQYRQQPRRAEDLCALPECIGSRFPEYACRGELAAHMGRDISGATHAHSYWVSGRGAYETAGFGAAFLDIPTLGRSSAGKNGSIREYPGGCIRARRGQILSV